MSELGKLREDYAQEVPRLYELCEKLHENQKSLERQLTGLRSFAQHVERFLDQLDRGATAPSDSRQIPTLEPGRASVPLGYVPGASASSFARPPSYLQTPRPPNVPAPPVPQDSTPASGKNASPSEPNRVGATHLARCGVRFDLEQSELTSPTLYSGRLETLRFNATKKMSDHSWECVPYDEQSLFCPRGLVPSVDHHSHDKPFLHQSQDFLDYGLCPRSLV